MPHSRNPHQYPIICWNVMEAFKSGTHSQLDIDAQDMRESDTPLDPARAYKNAQAMRFQFNAFRNAIRETQHPDSYVLDALEFGLTKTPSGGTVHIRKRDTGGFTRAVEIALRKPSATVVVAPTPIATSVPIETTSDIEAQMMRDGVASTKKFEAVMLQLGFGVGPDALKPPPKEKDPSNDT